MFVLNKMLRILIRQCQGPSIADTNILGAPKSRSAPKSAPTFLILLGADRDLGTAGIVFHCNAEHTTEELGASFRTAIGAKTDTALDIGWCEEVILTIDVDEGADSALEHFDTSIKLVGVGVCNGAKTSRHSCEDKCLGL